MLKKTAPHSRKNIVGVPNPRGHCTPNAINAIRIAHAGANNRVKNPHGNAGSANHFDENYEISYCQGLRESVLCEARNHK
jgi:hypothetical protein